ncbi:MAG: DUF4388 domain-containing protein [Gammaproteobacteria bacterium]|nr:DUF4388 domain-containing protein [Gammaproteobacteria bacterium]
MKKILVILHDTILLSTFKIGLHNQKNQHHDLLFASSFLEGAKILKTNDVDTIIMELLGENIDCLSLLLLTIKEFPTLNIVILTQSKIRGRSFNKSFYCANNLSGIRQFITLLTDIEQPNSLIKKAEDILMGDLFLLIKAAKKSCFIEIKNKKSIALIYFHDGVLSNSLHGDHEGEQAVLDILGEKCTALSFRKIPKQVSPHKISLSLEKLILQYNEKDEILGSQDEVIVLESPLKKEEQIRLQNNLIPLHDIDGYLASAIFDMSGLVMAEDNQSDYNISLIGINATMMVNSAVDAVRDAGLGKCNFIQVNSENGIFNAVWAVEDQSIATVLLDPHANVGMAKIVLDKVGKLVKSE